MGKVHYRQWWEDFSPRVYLAGLADTGVAGAQEKLSELDDAEAKGFHAEKFCVLNEERRGVGIAADVTPFLVQSRFEYNTTRHGPGHAHILVVICRLTGKKDASDREIYQTSRGALFVEARQAGSPEHFGRCELIHPCLG